MYFWEVIPVYFSKLILSPVLEFPTKFSAQPINSYLHQNLKFNMKYMEFFLLWNNELLPPPFLLQGVPHLQEDNDDSCETTIEWLTQYACVLDSTATNSWVINNTVTHQVFNLTKLRPVLSSIYVEQDGTKYNYTIALADHTVGECGSHTDNVGACQVKVGTNEAHLLGRVNNTLQLLGEELRVEYTNGSFCTHVHRPRKAVITFECDSREFLQVLPESDCEYSFVVHTNLACAQTSAISVECSVDGFDDLQVFLSLKSPPIVISNTSSARAFISVCDPISRDNQENSTALQCPSGAAACIIGPDKR